ncbi:hypothetical protein [Edaphovirga cremea]|uniref:hypothetical protein n=1 Tax=Edaphovirga cremea TaxID=2267246 RepID=UPI001300A1ED|nr:hypothetical protein [Edaphovirga cremea]
MAQYLFVRKPTEIRVLATSVASENLSTTLPPVSALCPDFTLARIPACHRHHFSPPTLGFRASQPDNERDRQIHNPDSDTAGLYHAGSVLCIAERVKSEGAL